VLGREEEQTGQRKGLGGSIQVFQPF